jgi:nucleoside-diphosphate-sugar epimerase
MSLVKILLTGATGYIGGDLLIDLLERSSEFQVYVLIRGSERSSTFEKLGAKVIVGSQDDHEFLTKTASEFDVVISVADSIDVGITKAFLLGLEQGKQQHNRKAILIQTSGSGVVLEPTAGEYATEKIWSDLDVQAFYELPLQAPHRELDIYVTEYPQNKVTTAIISPGNIYGVGRGPYNRLSFINIAYERAAIKYGKAYVVGQGANIWSTSHVRDLSTAYINLLDGLLNGTAGHGLDGYYFVETTQVLMAEVVQRIAEVLHKKGLVQDTNLIDMPEEVLQDPTVMPAFFVEYPGLAKLALGGTSRVSADRLRKIGWKPEHTDPLDATADELNVLLAA